VAIGLLAILVPVAFGLSPLVIGLVATLIVAGVAIHESVFTPAAAAERLTVDEA
jgi:hypothetical protein